MIRCIQTIMPYIQHKLGKTFYLSQGPKNTSNLPIVGLHGGPGSTHSGRLALLNLSNKRKVYIYDQIGGGKSSVTQQKHWTIETFTQELHTLIQAWGLKQFHLYGGSWGTTLALEYYLRYKNNGVASLIFQSPLFSGKDWSNDAKVLIKKLPQKYQKIIRYCHEIGATDAAVYQQAMHEYYKRHVLRDEKKLSQMLNPKKGKNNNGKNIYQYMWGESEFFPTGTLKNYNQVQALKKITVPCLLMCGQYDEARPETSQKYTKMIKSAQYKTIKGAAHAVLTEKPNEVLKHVGQFISEVEKRR